MARKRTSVNKIRKILQLHEGKLSQRQISSALKISRPVISEILSKCTTLQLTYQYSSELSDTELSEMIYGSKRTSNKSQELLSLFPEIALELSKVGVTKQLLWTEYLEKHPNGLNYSQFCHLFKTWQKSIELSMHIEYKAGDKLLVDYAGKKLRIFDHEIKDFKEVEVFVAILGCSGMLYVEVSENQTTKSFIRSIENALHFYGGAPNAIVSDNLKAAVIKADKYEPELNQQTEEFVRYYRTALLPTRAFKPKDKAIVESAVSLTYQRVYAPLRNQTFYSIEQLNDAIKLFVNAHNNRKMQKMAVTRQELFNEKEKSKLKTLPQERYPLKTMYTGKAGFNYHVYMPEDMHYYSVPYLYAGKQVSLIYDEKNVAIHYQNERICLHKRKRASHQYSTIADHMPPNHRFYHDWSPKRFKDWAKSIGKETYLVISHILESRKHPEQAFKVCLGILNMEKKYTAEVLNITCRNVWNREQVSYSQIKLTIDHVQKQIEENNASKWNDLPQGHENIRGNTYK